MNTSETERMKQRLAGLGLREVPTPQDGNCQFASVAHQLFGDSILPWDSDKCKRIIRDLRGMAADWLRLNGHTRIGTESLEDFLDPIHESWEAYCDYIEGDTNWGDHLSLVAISNLFKVEIIVVGSQASQQPITRIRPFPNNNNKNNDNNNVLVVSHWHERHYNSLVAHRRSL